MFKKGITIGPNDTDLRSTEKKNIEEYNLEEIRGWIIDELNKIEEKIDLIITNYFKPKNESEFKNIILNTSIVSTGAKMKILRNIDTFENNIIDKIRIILSIRNAFAHLPITKSAQVSITNKKGDLIWKLESVISQLDIMNSSGEIKKKNAKELINEFEKLIGEINNYLSKTKKPNS